MNTQSTPKQPTHYTYQNQQQYPFLTKVAHFQKAKERGQNQTNWQKFLVQSGPLFTKWFNWTGPQYILVEIDEKDKKVKFFQKHPFMKTSTYVSQSKVKGQLILTEVRNFNEKIEIDLKKNFVNGAITPSFTYNWVNYNPSESQGQINSIVKLGVKFDFKKWLSNNMTTNEKKIFFKFQGSVPSSLNLPFPIEMYEATLFLANRSNYHQLKNKNSVNTDSVVKKSSDIIGYSFSSHYEKLGIQLGIQGGYDYFQRYNFNKLIFKFGNFQEFEKHVIEMSVRAGAVFGKNLMENDLFSRTKTRWVDERSTQFLSTRFNFIFKNFHPIFGGVFQIVPLFYIQGCASRNMKQIRTKLELDYGIGIRFLNVGLTLDTSLIRIGKNLDDINPSIRIVF